MVLHVLLHGVPSICPICGFIYCVGGGAYLVVPSLECCGHGFPWSEGMIELVGESGFGVKRLYRSCPQRPCWLGWVWLSWPF